MNIPKMFKLFNQEIKVIFKSDLIDRKGAFGIWDYNKNTIYLQRSTRKYLLTSNQIHQTFIHECLHASLDLMGEHRISEDEKFISSLSNLIYQLLEQLND